MNNDKYIINEQARRDTASMLRRAIAKATAAADYLVTSPDLPGLCVEDISGFTEDWLQRAINFHVKAIKSDPTITSAERPNKLQYWYNLQQRAREHVQVIQGVVSTYPELRWQRNSDGKFFVPELNDQVERIALDRATQELPALAGEHRRLILQVFSAVEQLRGFEYDNKIEHKKLLELRLLLEHNGFFQTWVCGGFYMVPSMLKYRNDRETITTKIF